MNKRECEHNYSIRWFPKGERRCASCLVDLRYADKSPKMSQEEYEYYENLPAI